MYAFLWLCRYVEVVVKIKNLPALALTIKKRF